MSKTYTLVLDVDDASLKTFKDSQSRIILAKPAGNAAPNVVWLSLQPSLRRMIAWDERYGIYSAQLPSRNGAKIEASNRLAHAEDGMLYSFRGGAFDQPIQSLRIPRGHYDVSNDAPFSAVFGLEQTARVNGRAICSPVNATILHSGMRADFAPVPRIYIWIEAELDSGSIFPDVPSDATVIVFDPADATKSYRYATESSVFVPSVHRTDPLRMIAVELAPKILRLA